MTDLSKLSDDELKALYEKTGAPQAAPDLSKMSDDELKAAYAASAPKPEFHMSDAVMDIPAEIARTAKPSIEAISNLANRSQQGPLEGLLSTGRAALAVPQLIASPVVGTLKSLIGHPMAQVEHTIGSFIAPEIAAKDNPETMYRNAAGDVETALSAAKPVGAPVRSVPMGPPRISTLSNGATMTIGPRPVLDWQFPTTTTPPPVPTVDELKNASRAGYRSPEVAAVQINPQAVQGLSTRIENELVNQGFRPRAASAPGTFEEVRGLVPPQGVPYVNVADLDSARRALGLQARQLDAVGQPTAEAAAARIAVDRINDFLPNLQQPDLLAGDAARANQILEDARQNWGAAKRAEQVQTLADNARIQAASTYGGGNINNATRQALRPLLRNNAAKARGFNQDELDALSQAVEGSWLGNTLRQVGKYGPDTGLKGLEHIAAAIGTGGTSIPFSAAAGAARLGGDAATRAAVSRLDTALRSRSPLARLLAAQNQPTPVTPSRLAAVLAFRPGNALQIPASLVPAYAQQDQQ